MQGTYETFVEAGRQHFGGDLAGRWILTAGLGGMGGAQPLAATLRRRRRRSTSNASRAASTSACARATSTSRRSDLDDALALIARHTRAQARRSRSACSATPPRSLPELRDARQGGRHPARPRHRPDLGARPRSTATCRPAGASTQWQAAQADPAQHARADATRRRRVVRGARAGDARLPGAWASRRSTTATTSARSRSTRASPNAFDFPGFVPAYIRPLFCRRQGAVPLGRAVGRPGRHPQDRREDEGAVPATTRTCTAGSTWRGERIAFQGLPARICWLGLGERHLRRPGLQRDGEDAAS